MIKFKDITNQKFGHLTAVKEISFQKKEKYKIRTWQFLCDCGSLLNIRASQVTCGINKHCGCRAYEDRNRKFDLKEASYRAKAGNYKYHAKRRKLSWNLTIDGAVKILKSNCYYCGLLPDKTYNSIKNRMKKEKQNSKMSQEHINNGEIFYSGIDRIDNNIGYESDNVVPCCTWCNFAKRDKPYIAFITWIKQLVKYRINRDF